MEPSVCQPGGNSIIRVFLSVSTGSSASSGDSGGREAASLSQLRKLYYVQRAILARSTRGLASDTLSTC